MDFDLSPETKQFQQEVRSFIERNLTPELQAECRTGEGAMINGPLSRRFQKELAEQGLLGAGWPAEYGGQGLSAIDQWVLTEELTYWSLPNGDLSIGSVGPTIARIGTDEQKKQYLPGIINSDITFGIGYTEPGAGTDLASLQTRAVRDGDHYVINGQKIFTTHAHIATHVWLACRTDPNAPKHRGISVVIVPIDSPGLTVQPLWSQADSRTNMTYYDNVRVPVSNLIGKENEGWKIIMMALDFERALPTAEVRHAFDSLVEYAKTTQVDSQPLIRKPQVRQTIARLAVDLEVCRLLSLDAAWQVDQGVVPTTGFSMGKVWTSELKERLANAGIEVLGPKGLLRPDDEGSITHGVFDMLYRSFPPGKFAGGTNDIQRNIIAQRGLGLPRD